MAASSKYTHPTEKWTLRGDAAASYLRERADGHPAGGIDVYSRTRKQQEALYKAYKAGRGPIAANPDGDPPHMDGRAMDYRTTSGSRYAPSAAHVWASQGTDGSKSPRQLGKSSDWSDRAAKYGWGRTVPSERWHREYNRAKDTHRAAGLKAALKTLGAQDLKAFQRSRKITADGVDGPITWAEILRQIDKLKPAPKLGDRVLRRGDTGPDVAELSKLLTARGHDVGVPANSFGSAVEKAVIAEQTAGGLKPVDGKVGPDTLAWLRKPPVTPAPPEFEQPPIVEPPDAPQDPDDTQDPTPEEPEQPVTAVPDPIRVAALNCQDPRFGGSTTDTRVQGLAAAIEKTGAVLVALSECPDDARSKRMRTRLRKALPGGTGRWKVWTSEDAPGVAILFNSKVVTPVSTTEKVCRREYGKAGYHGSVSALFKVDGRLVAFGAYHLQPNSIASLSSQEDAVQATAKDVLSLKAPVAVLAGDGVNSDTWLPGWTATRVAPDKDKATYADAKPDRIHIQGATPSDYRVLSAPSDHQAVAVTVIPTSSL